MKDDLRILSLLPSATEWVCTLGFGKQLVGRSHACDWPPEVESLPICTRPRIRTDVPSLEIDRDVKDHLQSGTPLYEVSREQVTRLDPHVIITQSHCEVCAVTKKDVEAVLGAEAAARARIVSLMPNRLADIWQDARAIAEALDKPAQAQPVLDGLQTRVQAIAQSVQQDSGRKARIAGIEWIDPLMAGGNWVPELITLAGGVDLLGQSGVHSPWITWDDLVKSDPDKIFVFPCGFGLDRTAAEMAPMTRRAEWNDLRAVRDGEVYLFDGHHYFNRPGPRVVESLEMFAEILHPHRFNFGHHGVGWRRWQ